MKKTKKTLLSTAIAAALMFAASSAMAQTATNVDEDKDEADNTAELSEITVTARRREETLQEVPVAVTAFTETAIEEFNIEDLGDLDAYVPNLTIYSARGSSSTITAYIRGVGQSDPLWGVDPGVGIYIDDVYMARPQGGLLDVVDVERVEVLRGPQGTLYGKNTIGGAIKYITKPLSSDVEGAVSIGVGNYDQLDVKASLNAPLGSDAVLGRLSVASLNRDGFGENRFSGQDVSDKEILVARGTVGFYPNEAFNVIVSADWLDDQSGVRGGTRLNAFNQFEPQPRTPPFDDRYDIASGMPNVNDTQLQGASVTANWTINESLWFKSITAYRESDTDTNIDFDQLPNRIVDVRALYSDDQTSQEFQLNFAGDQVDGVMGFYWFDGTAGGTVFNNFLNASFGTTNGQVDTESWALYGEATWRFSEAWSLTGGLRYTDEEKTADVLNQAFNNPNFTGNPIATPADFNDSVDFQNWSPKVSLDWQATDDVLVYGLVSQGFKSGGFNIRANVTAFPESARPFDDEKVTSYEFGTKTAWADGRVYLNAAVFYNDYKDVQLSVFTGFDSNGDGTDDAFFGDFTNAGAATVKGLELELAANLTDRWTVNANAAFTDAEYDEFITSNINVADVQKFTNTPERSGALSTQYVWDVFGGSLSGRITGTYQSEVYPTTDLSEAIKQGGYSLYNAGLIWRSDESPWILSLQAQNLTDKEYRTTGYNIGALGILTGFYGAPRQYTLTATYLFD